MTEEQLKKANELVNEIVSFKSHKETIIKYSANITNIQIFLEDWNSQSKVRLRSPLFVISADRQMQFYLDELDKHVAKLEAELAAL